MKHKNRNVTIQQHTSPIDPTSKYLTTFLADNEDKSTIPVRVEDKKEHKTHPEATQA